MSLCVTVVINTKQAFHLEISFCSAESFILRIKQSYFQKTPSTPVVTNLAVQLSSFLSTTCLASAYYSSTTPQLNSHFKKNELFLPSFPNKSPKRS